MVIKRSSGGPCKWRAVNFEIHLWSSGRNADCILRSICIQHVQIEAGLNSDPGNDSFWDKSVTPSMLIDLLTSTCRSTQVKIASTDLWPRGMFTFSEMLALVESESSFGACVCHRRPGGSLATSDLVRCMSRWSLWGAERGWADVGLWVAVCSLAKISSQRPTCKTTFARLTQSQAISQSFHVFISFRSRRDTTFFFIFWNCFLYKITVSFTMVIKRSPGGQACRWRAVNFEIHLWSSGKNADCIFGDQSASSMSKWRPAWTLTPEMIPFGTKSVTLSMLIDLLTSTMSCRSTQVKIASTDLWPQEMFTFLEMLALVQSESSFGAYVCHRRPGGSTATSDLVAPSSRGHRGSTDYYCPFKP